MTTRTTTSTPREGELGNLNKAGMLSMVNIKGTFGDFTDPGAAVDYLFGLDATEAYEYELKEALDQRKEGPFGPKTTSSSTWRFFEEKQNNGDAAARRSGGGVY